MNKPNISGNVLFYALIVGVWFILRECLRLSRWDVKDYLVTIIVLLVIWLPFVLMQWIQGMLYRQAEVIGAALASQMNTPAFVTPPSVSDDEEPVFSTSPPPGVVPSTLN